MKHSLHSRGRLAPRAALAWLSLSVAGCAYAVSTCTVGVGNVTFGAYTGVQITSSATMTITCTHTSGGADTIDFTATLSTGAGSYAQRLLTHIGAPPDTLPYNLYLGTVPAILNTNVWGDGSGATVTATGTVKVSNGQPTRSATFTVAGAMATVAAMPTAGTYEDIIAATVTYN